MTGRRKNSRRGTQKKTGRHSIILSPLMNENLDPAEKLHGQCHPFSLHACEELPSTDIVCRYRRVFRRMGPLLQPISVALAESRRPCL